MKCAGKPHMRNHLSLKPFPSHLHLYKPLMRNYPSSKTVSETFPFTSPCKTLMRNHPSSKTLSLKPFPSHLHLYKPLMRNHPLPRLSLKPFPSHLHLYNRHSFETAPSPRHKLHLMCMCCSACASETGAYEKMYEKTGVEVQSDMYQLFPMYWLSSWYKLDLTCISFSADAS